MKKNVLNISILLLTILTLQSCFNTNKYFSAYNKYFSTYNEIKTEYDQVKLTKRLVLKFYHSNPIERRTPLHYIKQTILKEVKPGNEIIYTVYDHLVMSTNAHNLENQLYLILDQDAIPIDINNLQVEHSSSISEDKDTILTSDSTRVSVVKGYTQQARKHFKISYQLSLEIMDKISQANEVNFKYYCGPQMLTIALNEAKLNRLKEMTAIM